MRRNVRQARGVGGGKARATTGWSGRETQGQTWGSDWAKGQERIQHRRSAQSSGEGPSAGDHQGGNKRKAAAREATKADAQRRGSGTGKRMITRGRKREAEGNNLGQKRPMEVTKRVRGTHKRIRTRLSLREAANQRQAREQGNATEALDRLPIRDTNNGTISCKRKRLRETTTTTGDLNLLGRSDLAKTNGEKRGEKRRERSNQSEWEERNEEVT